ncbi:hypothetical protein ONZ45_g8679 [Pleurotus djamor]|nr:hypothetical protein ONZ45_g8679 [Pleurotus djamor]
MHKISHAAKFLRLKGSPLRTMSTSRQVPRSARLFLMLLDQRLTYIQSPTDPSFSRLPRGPIDRGFLDTLHSVDQVGSKSDVSLMGPLGPLVAPAAGALLGAIVGIEPSFSRKQFSSPTLDIVDRALLAEVSLQVILNVKKASPDNPFLRILLQDISTQYVAHAPDIYEIAKALSPRLMKCAYQIAGSMLSKIWKTPVGYMHPASFPEPQPLTGLPTTAEWSTIVASDAFVKGLCEATLPVIGVQQNPLHFLGGVISRAVTVPSEYPPLVSQASKDALPIILPHLLDYSNVDGIGHLTHVASKTICQRALVADAALTSLRKLPRSYLDRFGTIGPQGKPETMFAYIKRTLQTFGPDMRSAAQFAFHMITPNLMDVVSPKRKMGFSAPPSKNRIHPNIHYYLNVEATYRN